MEELILEAKRQSGFAERVLAQEAGDVTDSTFREQVDSAIEELRAAWGPTRDPFWADKAIPGRDFEKEQVSFEKREEFDSTFALFEKSGYWGCVRVRATDPVDPTEIRLKLVIGVAKQNIENQPV